MRLVLFQIHVETFAFNINHKTYTYKYIQRMIILNPFLDDGTPPPRLFDKTMDIYDDSKLIILNRK